MDTQGLYDHETSNTTCAKILTLSALLSSVQIMNVMNRIEAMDLQFFELILNLASGTVGNKLHNSNGDGTPVDTRRQGGSPLLQTLVFLVRDWANQKKYSYGFEGGEKYIHDVILSSNAKDHALVHLHERIKVCSTELKTYLMPHPGFALLDESGRESTNAALNKDFRENVAAFIAGIFRDHLTAKKFNGQMLKGEGFLKLVEKYVEAFNSMKDLEIGTLAQAQAKFVGDRAVTECVEKYEKRMDEECHGRALGADELRKWHEDVIGEVTQLLSEKLAWVSQNLDGRVFTKKLNDRCEAKYGVIERDMANSKLFLKDLVQMLEEEYEENMKEITKERKPLPVDILHNRHVEESQRTIESFNHRLPDAPNPFVSYFQEEQRKILEQKLKERFIGLQERNNQKRENVATVEKYVSEKMKDCIKKFESDLEQRCKGALSDDRVDAIYTKEEEFALRVVEDELDDFHDLLDLQSIKDNFRLESELLRDKIKRKKQKAKNDLGDLLKTQHIPVAVDRENLAVDETTEEIVFQECTITCKPGTFQKGTKLDLQMMFCDGLWPDGYIGITRFLELNSSKQLCNPVKVRMETLCTADKLDHELTVDVLHLPKGGEQWKVEHTIPLPDEKYIEFDCPGFCWRLAGLRKRFLRWKVSFPAKSLLCLGERNNDFECHCFCDHSRINRKVDEEIKEKELKKKIIFPSFSTKLKDKIEFCLYTDNMEKFEFWPHPGTIRFVIGQDFVKISKRDSQLCALRGRGDQELKRQLIQVGCNLKLNDKMIGGEQGFNHWVSCEEKTVNAPSRLVFNVKAFDHCAVSQGADSSARVAGNEFQGDEKSQSVNESVREKVANALVCSEGGDKIDIGKSAVSVGHHAVATLHLGRDRDSEDGGRTE